MNKPPNSCQATIIVKALPRPSNKYAETVCCAGVTDDGQWKRLYPVRYRHGSEDFGRWDRVEFEYVQGSQDRRPESCKLLEGTLKVIGKTPSSRRRELLEPLICGSAVEAAAQGKSLTIIRPAKIKFLAKRKRQDVIEAERMAYAKAARQHDFLDKEVGPLDPPPFQFGFSFSDTEGFHTYSSGDWETYTTFWKWRKLYGQDQAIEMLRTRFEQDFAKRGIAFALGTIAKRPKQWTLLGVVRLDDGPFQTSLF